LCFGPDQGNHRDGLVVEEELSEVVPRLAEQGQWPRFTRSGSGEVFVNPASVRFAQAGPATPKRGETNIREVEVR
jgi:hypothetical protein